MEWRHFVTYLWNNPRTWTELSLSELAQRKLSQKVKSSSVYFVSHTAPQRTSKNEENEEKIVPNTSAVSLRFKICFNVHGLGWVPNGLFSSWNSFS